MYVSLKNHFCVPNCVTVTPTTGSGARLFPPFQRVGPSFQFQGVNMTPFMPQRWGPCKVLNERGLFLRIKIKEYLPC